LEKDFFQYFGYDEFNVHNLDINVDLVKNDNLLNFNIKSSGTIQLVCDISGENYHQETTGEIEFLVKFGDEYNDDNEDLIILPYNSHTINIAQQIYETVLLSIPQKRIHPDIISGKIKTENTQYIINYQDNKNKQDKKEIDPRWAALEKILTNKK
jgi:uncharacterized metal-binding protein YceD (DUF177 family)